MQIIIDIDNDLYTRLFDNGKNYVMDMRSACAAIRNGRVIPKGHGRLIDADKELAGLKEMKVVDEADKQSVRFAILEFEYAKPIIEADMESEEQT